MPRPNSKRIFIRPTRYYYCHQHHRRPKLHTNQRKNTVRLGKYLQLVSFPPGGAGGGIIFIKAINFLWAHINR